MATQIIKNTGNELIVRQVPTAKRIIFLIVLIACLGGSLSVSDTPLNGHFPEMGVMLFSVLALTLMPLLSLVNVTWVFDRSMQSFAIIRKGLFRPQSSQYALSEISSVVVLGTTDADGAETFTVRLKLSNGTFATLSRDYGLSEVNAKDAAWHIAQFLGTTYDLKRSR
jgi:hypothetical protein